MNRIELEAHAKINWSLLITGRRDDGYHLLDMLMQEIELHDDIAIEKDDRVSFRINGNESDDKTNLVMKALYAVSDYCGKNLHASFSLTKRIPSRAGLGGGSADCAKTILGLNMLFDLHLSMTEMEQIALKLGADVPFFLTGGLQRVRGIGEKLTKIDIRPRVPLVVKHVGEGLSTKEVYSLYDHTGIGTRKADIDAAAKAIANRDFELLKTNSANDLEKAAFALDGEIEKEINRLYDLGALYARMSGSGSAVYGVFADESAARAASCMMEGSIVTLTI